jgi:hypothetical protein
MSRRQTAESKCSKCYAPILWASQSTGGQIPLNISAEQITGASQGPFFMLDELEMRCTRASLEVIETAIEKGRKLWTNHLVTCQKRERSAA